MKVRLLIIASALLILQGCIYVSEDKRGRDRTGIQPTIGQELLDLDRARSQGILSESEYERLRASILRQNRGAP